MARQRWWLAAVLVIALAGIGLAQGTGEVVVRAALDGRPADVKVLVRQGEKVLGIHYNPTSSPGLVRISLPPGTYTLVVDRGAGFTRPPVVREVTVQAGRTVELSVELPHGFSPSQAWGYYAGDPHNHSGASFDAVTPPEELVAVQLAADLDLGFLTDHNTCDGHASYAAAAASRRFPVVLGIEITAIRWHWNAYPVEPYAPQIQPMTWMGLGSPAPTFAEARAKGARFIQVNHPYSSTAPYFESLGKPYFDYGFDLVEIANGTFSESDARTIEQMFKFWNEGRRYMAVGVSDAHDWKDPADPYGRPRTYVYVEGEFTAEKWLQGLGKGQAFVTYGPLVNLIAQGTARPGDTVALRAGEELQLQAELFLAPREGPRGLALLQVIRNGEVIGEIALGGKGEATVSFTDRPTRSCWYIVRVVATDGDQAWTNPIWVEVK